MSHLVATKFSRAKTIQQCWIMCPSPWWTRLWLLIYVVGNSCSETFPEFLNHWLLFWPFLYAKCFLSYMLRVSYVDIMKNMWNKRSSNIMCLVVKIMGCSGTRNSCNQPVNYDICTIGSCYIIIIVSKAFILQGELNLSVANILL